MPNLPDSLQGVALVASPQMIDPRFAQTVVLLLHHDEEGAMGVVLNRPISAEQQKALVTAASLTGTWGLNFHFGGPVAGPVIVLQAEESDTGAQQGKMFFVNQKDQFSRLLRHASECRFFVGHATWDGGQLEQEIDQGLWKTLPVSPKLLFGEHEQLWAQAIRAVGRSFYRDTLGITGFPADATLN